MHEKLRNAFAAFGVFQAVCIIVMTIMSVVSSEYNVCVLQWCIN